ncbi:MAG: hypothetical protein AVDCRST_MAG90-3091 [uncultured Microvirga sp.]|uniref:Uncharacterized protein n=1 Tax=uncultured Microvirga sp. TaxID=412392 RepID=A0A6J4MNP4_9HYPH|nr:MAG: hypothetical protein AVDCRST_MAG90-3091 [uncultured Microvirga sp.]
MLPAPVVLRSTLIEAVPSAPPVKESDFVEALPIVVASTDRDLPWNDLSARAWRILPCIDSTVLVIDFIAISAASSVLMPCAMPSSSALRSEARRLRPAAVKNFEGLSRAELTFLPVARRFWMVPCSSDVVCRARRFERMALESTMPDMAGYLSRLQEAFCSARPSWSRRCTIRRRPLTRCKCPVASAFHG